MFDFETIRFARILTKNEFEEIENNLDYIRLNFKYDINSPGEFIDNFGKYAVSFFSNNLDFISRCYSDHNSIRKFSFCAPDGFIEFILNFVENIEIIKLKECLNKSLQVKNIEKQNKLKI